MSYNDLSKSVGIRKASIHYHFPKKEDLISALVNRCQIDYGQRYNTIVEMETSAEEKLFALAAIFEEGVRNNKLCLIGMLSVEQASLNEIVRHKIDEAINQTTDIYEKVFQQGIKENLFSKDQPTHDLAYGFFSFLLGAQIMSRCSKTPEGFRRAAKAYIQSLFHP